MRAFGLCLVVSVLVSVPASAQFYRVPAPARAPVFTTAPATRGMSAPVRQVLSDIREGARLGELSHKQAKELRREAGEISELESRYAVGGLSDAEAAELRSREEVLHAIVNAKRSGVIK